MKKNISEINIVHELFLIFVIFALGFITCKLFFNQTVLFTKIDFSDKVLVKEEILDFDWQKYNASLSSLVAKGEGESD